MGLLVQENMSPHIFLFYQNIEKQSFQASNQAIQDLSEWP